IPSHQFENQVGEVLQSILDTEISPELVPAKDGANIQSTQQKIGPYELQDFTLYYLLRFGLRPSKIAFYAWHAWHDVNLGRFPAGFPTDERNEYTMGEIKNWMELFLRRFFANQFKRSTLPNGPKVVAGGTLSPRGDWRMPSDISGSVWLKDLENIELG
ncbi:MAG: NAD(+) synthase, partial [Ancrocorticia populi]